MPFTRRVLLRMLPATVALSVSGLGSPVIHPQASTPSTVSTETLPHRLWALIDTMYADPRFDRSSWQRAQPLPATSDSAPLADDVSMRRLLRGLNDRAVDLVTADQLSDLTAQLTGGPYSGVGLVPLLSLDVSGRTGHLVVVTTRPDTPAGEAGLQSGEEIDMIDGRRTDTLSILEATGLLRGKAGSHVSLGVRGPAGSRVLTLTRRVIAAPARLVHDTVLAMPSGRSVGYLAIEQFTAGSAVEFRAALARVLARGVSLLIIDVRGNPGGTLPSCQAIAGMLMGPRRMATQVGPGGRASAMETTGSQLTALPLAVMVNRATASAAEVLTMGLQATGRAVVVGEPTFGKALVHNVVSLDGRLSVLLTIGRLDGPSGQPILNIGITPNVVVTEPTETGGRANGTSELASDPLVRAAFEALRTRSPKPDGT